MAPLPSSNSSSADGGRADGASSALSLFLSCAVVAAIWGGSNPFLKQGSEQSAAAPSTYTGIAGKLETIVRTLLNWRFSVPFIINQSGSLAFNFLLGSAPLTLVAPITNALTFIFTGITAKLLGEPQPITWRTIVGTLLIVSGLPLCMWNQLSHEGPRQELP